MPQGQSTDHFIQSSVLESELIGGAMPSFTLEPPGDDKSTIRFSLNRGSTVFNIFNQMCCSLLLVLFSFSFSGCHFLGCPLFGIIPKLLMYKLGNEGKGKGPATLPSMTLLAKYSSTLFAFRRADCLFFFASLS